MGTNHFSPLTLDERVLSSSVSASIGRRIAGSFMDLLLAFTMAYVIPVVGPLLCIIYFLNKDAFPFLQGQSVGKKLLQTRVVKQGNGKPITKDYPSSILRSVTLLIPGLNLLEVIRISLNKERFGDRWAGTMVIKV